MSQGFVVDIGPKKRREVQGECVTGNPDTDCPSGYTAYKYVHQEKVDFDLTGISYEGETIECLKTFQKVTNVITYFKNSDLLLIHLKINRKDFYYARSNFGSAICRTTTFDKFVAGGGRQIGREYLRKILANIDRHHKLYYEELTHNIKRELWRENEVVFQLVNYSPKKEYRSYVTGIKVTLMDSSPDSNLYKRVKHSTTSPFYIKGLEDVSGYTISVVDDLPIEPLDEFYVYYGKGDGTYGTPLLIILSVQSSSSAFKQVKKYLFSKTNDSTRWDKLTLGEAVFEDTELKDILSSIESKKKLDVGDLGDNIQSKLKDLTKNLVIDLKRSFDQGDGVYSSGGISISYKTTSSPGYTVITHAHNFQNFTVEKIVTTSEDITCKNHLIPTTNIQIQTLKVFYNGNTTANPSLIYLLHGSDRRWLKKHIGDKNWSILRFEIPKDDTDGEGIKSILEKLQIPNVIIDFSKPTSELYTPEGSPSEFNITDVPVPGSPGYYGLKHDMKNKGPFMLRKVIYRDIQLDGIRSLDSLDSITAFFHGNNPTSEEDILLIELKRADTSKYQYFTRKKNNSIWTEHEQATVLHPDQLRTKLDELARERFGSLSTMEVDTEHSDTPQEDFDNPKTKSSKTPSTKKSERGSKNPKAYDTSGGQGGSIESVNTKDSTSNEDTGAFSPATLIGITVGTLLGISLLAVVILKVAPILRGI